MNHVQVSRPTRTLYDAPKIVGYVLAKMEEDPQDGIQHGRRKTEAIVDRNAVGLVETAVEIGGMVSKSYYVLPNIKI